MSKLYAFARIYQQNLLVQQFILRKCPTSLHHDASLCKSSQSLVTIVILMSDDKVVFKQAVTEGQLLPLSDVFSVVPEISYMWELMKIIFTCTRFRTGQ